MNYTVITDEAALMKFINWLPILQNHETYYLCLFARSKYAKEEGMVHIKSDKQQLKRFCSKKENMIDKIRQLECEIGNYTQKGMPMPQEALGLYISVNPRNMWEASFNLMGTLASALKKGKESYQNYNPYQEAMSEIQKAKSRSCFVVFDIDAKPNLHTIKSWLKDGINEEAVTILETRGGYHILVHPDLVIPEFRKTWYQHIAQGRKEDLDQVGDLMIPIPGTYQGGFTPCFV